MSFCELCGRQSAEQKKVIVDGTVFNVCVACSKHGKPYVPQQIQAKKQRPAGAARQKNRITMADKTMLAPDFAVLIRDARMKLGLTHEQLGMKMNEKWQMLRKFETGALKPDELMAKKLERFLGIKLYVSVEEGASDEG
ncbi:MAG: multiprotein bridging factor aMBF1 [Nitrososphaera sp.]|nr:multiprotein bridging factor aMBF1 [Nitrososphaera sp.]